MMPVIAGLGALLAVILAIVMWPSDEKGSGAGKNAKTGAAAGEAGDGSVTAAGRAAGVAPRTYDEPSQRSGSGKINPAIRLAEVGLAPAGSVPAEDDTPPVFASTAEEIAWYEVRLERARKKLDARKKFADRLPAARERAANGPEPQRQLEVYEGRKKIVDNNYARAQSEVIEIERKLKELRG